MDKINFMRVVMGGLIAGLIINFGESLLNIFILEGEWEAAYERLGMPMTESTGMMIWYFASGFILGISGVAIYAAFRPRCGAGPRTALWAGFTIWFLTYFMGFSAMFFSGLFEMHLFWWTEIWGIVEIMLAVFAGAWFYKE